jgi:hypothetical protein
MKKMTALLILLTPVAAFAQGGAQAPDEAASALVRFLENGMSLPAVGAGLVLIVGLLRKWLAGRWPWFSSKVGGYALAYGATAVVYLGTALEQGQAVSGKLIWMALTAGLTASGVLDHWRDVSVAAKKAVPKIVPLLLLAPLLGGALGCHSKAGQVTLQTGQCVLDSGVEAALLADLVQANYAQLVGDAVNKFGPVLVQCALAAIAALPADPSLQARFVVSPDTVQARARQILEQMTGAN